MTRTMKEMVETACETFFHIDARGQEEWAEYCLRCPGLAEGDREDMRRALLAVLDKHWGPMLVEAFLAGIMATPKGDGAVGYSANVLKSIRAALEE